MARVALDIDSTLHPYWDQLDRVARDRHGVALPYAEQHDWGIPALSRDQLAACVAETHSDANIAAAAPYPGAVAAVGRWYDAGHWIHITSHRHTAAAPATQRWLDGAGFRYHDLRCSYDKVSRCVELGIDVLVDDSPINLRAALDRGIAVATLRHPWNAAVVAEAGIPAADRWDELAGAVDELLAAA